MKKFTAVICALIVLSPVFVFYGCGSSPANIIYDVEFDLDGNDGRGKEKVSFLNVTENTFTELKFNLFANAFRSDAEYRPIAGQYYNQAYRKGDSSGNITVLSVRSGGEELPFIVGGKDKNVLTVTLCEELFPNERAEVEIEYEIKLADVIARTGVNAKTVNLADFFPILCGITDGAFYECVYFSTGDPYFADIADFRVSISCDEKYVVATGGELLRESSDGGRKRAEYSLKNARSFTAVLSEDYRVLKGEYKDTAVNYYYYMDATPEESLKAAVNALTLFSALFGEYPYKNFTVCETEFIQGGMEFSALVYISDALEPAAYREVIAHETAHQWWQTVVGNNEIEHPFLDEGLAEYSVVLFYENYPEYGFTRKSVVDSAVKTFKVFCNVFDRIAGKTDTSMLRAVSEYSGEYEYVNIAYVKACVMLDTVRSAVGDKTFFSGLKRYYSENRFKVATPQGLIGAFERSGAAADGIFTAFFEGKELI